MINSMRRRVALVVTFTLAATLGGLVVAIPASAEVPNLFTGCVRSNGTLYKLMMGTAPSSPCSGSETQISIDNGDITSVSAGVGLTGGATLGSLTLAIADSGVTTVKIAEAAVTTGKVADGSIIEPKLAEGSVSTAKIADVAVSTTKIEDAAITTPKLADGSVTPDKISNDATEPLRIATWVDDTSDYAFNAYGPNETHLIPTTITVSVPPGKAHYYIATYDCSVVYAYAERAGGATSFYGIWSAALLDGTTQVGPATGLVATGYRQSWDALGGSNYWREFCHATWLIRLTEGSHSMTILIGGYSDNTMNTVHLQFNHLQMMQVN